MALAIQAAAKTDVGLVRANNEDNFGYDIGLGIFVVCDGMGGQAAGEIASKIAVDTVLKHFRHGPHQDRVQVVGRGFGEVSERANQLANAIHLANQAMHQSVARNPNRSGMGSTIVAVYVQGSQFSIAHVGDSRIYLVRGEVIQQLTSDHSLVMEQVRRGMITMEQAETSKMQNVILKALGSEESVEPDLADHELTVGDVLLLCSDGLSRYAKEDSMAKAISSASSLERACDDLIALAKTGGSDDNITCMLLRAVQQSRRGLVIGWLTAGSRGSERSFSWAELH